MGSDRFAYLRSIVKSSFPFSVTDQSSVNALRSYEAAGLVIARFAEQKTHATIITTAEVVAITRDGVKAADGSDEVRKASKRRAR